MRQGGWGQHMWVWWASMCGSRCHRGPHYQCSMSHLCSPPADEQTGWRCTAPPLYLTPGGENNQISLVIKEDKECKLHFKNDLIIILWTFGDGTTLKVFMMRSGYSSLILLMRSVPIPEPVPPPREWVSWNPWRQSQPSASFLTTSRTESTSSAPSV